MGTIMTASAAVAYSSLFVLVVLGFVWPKRLASWFCAPPIWSTARLKPVATELPGGPQWERHDSSHLYRSHLASGALGTLICLAMNAFNTSFFVTTLVLEQQAPPPWSLGPDLNFIIHFSNWAFMLFGLQGLLGFVVDCRGLARIHSLREVSGFDWLDKCFAAVVSAAPCISILVAAFHWVILYDGGQVTFVLVAKHGASAALLIAALFCGRLPLTSSWTVFPAFFWFAYLVFMWLYHDLTGAWVYDVLDWSSTWSLVLYFIIPWLLLAAFFFVFFVVKVREWVLGYQLAEYMHVGADGISELAQL